MGLIPVDTLLNVEDRTSPDQVAAFLAPLRADYRPSAEGFIRKFMFVPGTDPALIERIVRRAGAAPPEAAVAWLEATWGHDDAAAFEKVTVPIRAINADKFPTDREANRRHAPQFDAVILKGLGHYLMLEDPGRFDAALVRAVRDVAAEWAAAGVLQQQVQAWNRGDLEAFCSVYDEDATYASPSGLVRGPAAVLGRYRKRYPDRGIPTATGEPCRGSRSWPAGVSPTRTSRRRAASPCSSCGPGRTAGPSSRTRRFEPGGAARFIELGGILPLHLSVPVSDW
ncbi:MAG: hypothetical protein E6J47_09090 [Chloroflexi bacterium]|nr:MAG: hypothetical protein E6J47_09090 [Chloroflexota bacterium]